jgi:hypothetical protein
LLSRNLIADFDDVADKLAQMEGEIADAASVSTASDRLVSAKDSADAALAMLRQWAKDAEANDAVDAGAELKIAIARSSHVPAFVRSAGIRATRVCAQTSSRAEDREDVLRGFDRAVEGGSAVTRRGRGGSSDLSLRLKPSLKNISVSIAEAPALVARYAPDR